MLPRLVPGNRFICINTDFIPARGKQDDCDFLSLLQNTLVWNPPFHLIFSSSWKHILAKWYVQLHLLETTIIRGGRIFELPPRFSTCKSCKATVARWDPGLEVGQIGDESNAKRNRNGWPWTNAPDDGSSTRTKGDRRRRWRQQVCWGILRTKAARAWRQTEKGHHSCHQPDDLTVSSRAEQSNRHSSKRRLVPKFRWTNTGSWWGEFCV